MRGAAITALVALSACNGDLDPPWQLDHDRIIALRATPPAITSGETAELDGLLAIEGGPTEERVPDLVSVLTPSRLATSVAFDGGRWVVTAPDQATLAAAREELGLAADAEVPLQLFVGYAQPELGGLKQVRLGASAANPMMPVPMIADAPAPPDGEPVAISATADTPLAIEVPEEDDINWLTSCGTLHDSDLPQARISIEVDDPLEGELVVVRRDVLGGVVWQTWPIRADQP